MPSELLRQFFHFLAACILILFLVFFGYLNFLVFIATGIFIALFFSIAIKKGFLPELFHLRKKVERKTEKIPLLGALTFLLGVSITSIVFQKELVIIGSIIVLGFGDSVSTIVGKKIGESKILSKRSFEGTMAGIIASFLALQFIFPAPVALITSLIGMLAELLPIDDNISIPIVSAIVLNFLL